LQPLVQKEPRLVTERLFLRNAHCGRAQALNKLGRHSDEIEDGERALGIQEKLAAEFPRVPAYRQELAHRHNNLGLLLKSLGELRLAEQAFRRALSIQEKLAGEFSTVPEYRQELARSYNNLGLFLKELGQWPAAEQAYRQAVEIQTKLAVDFPTVPQYCQEQAGSCVNLGNVLRGQGQAEASLAWFAKAIALLEPLVQKKPDLITKRLFLRNAHWGRAQALDKLAQHAEAVKDWDRALALNAVPADERRIRRNRVQSLARTGEHAKAVTEANALAEAKDADAGTLYDLACVCAIASAKVKGAKNPGADASRLAEEYAARAVELLRQAVAKGFKDIEHMKKDTDLDALREREDFKKLLAEMEAKQKESRVKNQQSEKKQ
jgi:tetratricopeptide (TPR) repeat protein